MKYVLGIVYAVGFIFFLDVCIKVGKAISSGDRKEKLRWCLIGITFFIGMLVLLFIEEIYYGS